MQILFVEDNITFASVVCAKFLFGHDVTVVTSIHEARRRFNARRFDTVLVDFDLDDGKGSTFVEHLRTTGFNGQIIAVSSHEAGNAALMRSGADCSCPKRHFAEIPRLLRNMRVWRPVLQTAQHVEASSSRCEDRAAVMSAGETLVLVVADGAGGTSGGARAASQLVDLLGECLADETSDWVDVLNRTNRDLCRDPEAGQCTAVVAAVSPSGLVSGASVGDSAAFLVDDRQVVELTCNQQRKPLLGNRDVQPVPFSKQVDNGMLLLGSDGLAKYVERSTIIRWMREPADLNAICFGLTDAAKSATGSLQDDLAILLCRRLSPRAVG